MSLAQEAVGSNTNYMVGGVATVMFWVTLLATSILFYVLLDGFDRVLFGLTGSEPRRCAMLVARFTQSEWING